MPLESYAHQYKLQFAKRIALALPRKNLVTARLPVDFPLPSHYRTHSLRHLLRGNTNLPKDWNHPVRTRKTPCLPINALANLLRNTYHSMDPNTDFGVPFVTSSLDVKAISLNHWAVTHPLPDYYGFTPSTSPHLFMKLDKFICGRLHQVRAQKSYLAAHQTWRNSHLSKRCPRCYEEDKDFEHALLRCPQRGSARLEHIPMLKTVEDICPSQTTIDNVVLYLQATKTGFPPEMSSWFALSPSAASDVLSDVASNCSFQLSLHATNDGV
jgi:hypothetical protein